jgi:hypothetical protein
MGASCPWQRFFFGYGEFSLDIPTNLKQTLCQPETVNSQLAQVAALAQLSS